MKKIPILLASFLLPAVATADIDYARVALYQGRTVEAVELEGNDVTREHVIAREIRTRIGERLELETLRADVQRLRNLQIFSEITVEAEPAGEEGVRIFFVFREMPSWLPLLAAIYTEENGFSFGLALTAYNLTGRDIDLSAKAFFGGTTQYRLSGSWPWITGEDHLSLNLSAAHREREDTLNEFEERSDEFTPKVGRYLGESGRLNGMLSLFGMRADREGKTLSPDNQDLLLRLGFSLGWDTRDSWANPRRGWLNELEVWKTGGFLGGDGDFWTVILDVRRWQPATPRQKLLLSGLVSLQSGSVGEDVPEYLQYRLGGANTIRGYDVEELGKRLFGKNQLLGTAEYAFTLVPPRRFDLWKLSFRLGLELALFADAGVAWSESRELSMRRARAGVGAGLRLLTPVSEMVRLDVGWSPEGGFQLHLAGGSKPTRQRDRLR